MIGIDPDVREIERLRGREKNPNITYENAFIGSSPDHPFARKNKAGAIIGIYGNSKQEATYPIYTVDAAGEKLDGAKTRYALQFPPGQLPPVNAFWSATCMNCRSVTRLAKVADLKVISRTSTQQYESKPAAHTHGMESVFDFYRARFDAAKQSNVLVGFDLSAKDCAELFDESVLYHHRLLVLFRLKDWMRVERDAAHNLR